MINIAASAKLLVKIGNQYKYVVLTQCQLYNNGDNDVHTEL